jgi:preprotein translocase subunit YajC
MDLGSLTQFLPFLLLIVLFYFFLIRPESKKKKKLAEMRSQLTIGDDITTIGGIVGKVVQVTNDFITFETGEDRVRIQVTKWAISTVGKATVEQR